MHIGLDGRPLSFPLRGIGVYTNALIQRLPALAPHHRFTLYTDRPLRVAVPSAWTVRLLPTFSRHFWEMIQLPRVLKEDHVDLYHGVDHFAVPMHHVCPLVITVHDMAAWLFPETVSWKFHHLFRIRLTRAVHIADHIITVSRSTEADLHRLLPASRPKTSVIHLGVDVPPTTPHPSTVLHHLNVTKPYLLSVGALEPRKNLDTLLQAFALLKPHPPFHHYALILAGQPWRQADRLYQLARGIPGVTFTGHLPPESLSTLYREAELFVYPSYYEGFGLPPLEALAHGTPVVVSRTSSLPEVLEDAAEYVEDPKNPQAWATTIANLLNYPRRLAEFKVRGPLHAQRFPWDRFALATLKVYDQMVQPSEPCLVRSSNLQTSRNPNHESS